MQLVQRRLGKMRGEGRSNEEGVEQEAKIRQLTAELDQKTATHNHINEQIKRVNVCQTIDSPLSCKIIKTKLDSASFHHHF